MVKLVTMDGIILIIADKIIIFIYIFAVVVNFVLIVIKIIIAINYIVAFFILMVTIIVKLSVDSWNIFIVRSIKYFILTEVLIVVAF